MLCLLKPFPIIILYIFVVCEHCIESRVMMQYVVFVLPRDGLRVAKVLTMFILVVLSSVSSLFPTVFQFFKLCDTVLRYMMQTNISHKNNFKSIVYTHKASRIVEYTLLEFIQETSVSMHERCSLCSVMEVCLSPWICLRV